MNKFQSIQKIKEKLLLLFQMIGRGDNANMLFLLFAFSALTFLTYAKYHENNRIDQFVATAKREQYSSRFKIENSTLSLTTHNIQIANQLISNAQYRSFVLETGYVTKRERDGLWPRWSYPNCEKREDSDECFCSWQSAADLPVIWLSRGDAEAFCRWLAKQAGTYSPGFRLPTAEELEGLGGLGGLEEKAYSAWEWTSQDLSHFNHELLNAHEYLTSWKKGVKLRHRREIDMTMQEFEPTGFRVVWTVQAR